MEKQSNKSSINKTTKKTSTGKTSAKKTTSTPKTTKTINKTKTSTTSQIKKVELDKKTENNNAILTVLGIICLVIVVILIFRLTYAYFTATVINNNPSNEDVTIKTANLLVRYEDDNQILVDKIKPGDKISKNFKVISDETTTDTGYFTIVLEDLENTFDVVCPTEEEPSNGELIFTLLRVDAEGEEIATRSTGTLPCVTPAMTDKFILYTQDEVKAKETNYYKLVIEYKNFAHIDQSDNMDTGKLNAKINIIEVEDEKRTTP